MKQLSSGSKKIVCLAGAITGWFAVITQLVLLLQNTTDTLLAALIQFISFFTILTNTLVATYFTVIALVPQSGPGRFFNQPNIATAIAVYITVVGLVYNIILRHIWNPEGLQKLVDELLHSVIPVYFILYWILYISKATLRWENIFNWMYYPLLYFIYVLLRGAVTGRYPYPFVDVLSIGYPKVFINSGIVLLVFLVLSGLFIGAGSVLSAKEKE